MAPKIERLLSELHTALRSSAGFSAAQLLALAELAPTIQLALRRQTSKLDDPRLALALTTQTEQLAQETLRTQIHCAHLLEASGAHCLVPSELAAVRQGSYDLDREPIRSGARPSYPQVADLLAAWLDLDIFEARRRVAGAHLMICQFDPQGSRCPAQFTGLAQRFNTNGTDPREALAVARRLEKFEPPSTEFDYPGTASARTESGQLLETAALELLTEPEPKTRAKKLNRLMKSAQQQQRLATPHHESGVYRKGEKDGLICYELRFAPLEAEAFESLLNQADNPRTDAGAASRQLNVAQPSAKIPAHPDFVTDEQAASATWDTPAEATVARRRLQALMSLIQVNANKLRGRQQPEKSPVERGELTPSEEPQIPVIRPTVLVHLSLAELTGLAKTYGVGDHGFALGPAELRQALAKARIIPLVLGGRGEVLDIGRAQRNFPAHMRRAIKARDRGCLVPGCTVPPDHCELHHIWWWSRGGPTSVDLGCCLCTTHHHDVHAGMLKVRSNGGLPQVILPKFMDPDEVPRRNAINELPPT